MPIPQQERPVSRQSTRDVIYQALRDWIIRGELQPGEKINDAEIARHFQVSRTPVREAFQLLESQKLIRVVPGRSTTVTEIDKVDLENCYRPLAEIQALGARMAAPILTEAQLSQLQAILDRSDKACAENDAQAAISCDADFHALIMSVAGNEYMIDFSNLMLLHIQRIKYHFFHCDRMRRASVQQHKEILAALQIRDSEAAAQRMRSHWLSAMESSIRDVADSTRSTLPVESAEI